MARWEDHPTRSKVAVHDNNELIVGGSLDGLVELPRFN
jgi:hypothetical protein